MNKALPEEVWIKVGGKTFVFFILRFLCPPNLYFFFPEFVYFPCLI